MKGDGASAGTIKQQDMSQASDLEGEAVDTANAPTIWDDIREDMERRANGDGKVLVERFTPEGVRFTDGEEIPCDVVVYCTG